MTVFGLGRAQGTLAPGMSGTSRTFTLGLGEDNNTATTEITGAYLPLLVSVSDPTSTVSAVTGDLPRGLRLDQNYPNPFNPMTTISFALPHRGAVRLSVYDAAGHLVRTLVDAPLATGDHKFVWNGQDDGGRMAASGLYFYRLITPEHVLNGKMTLLE